MNRRGFFGRTAGLMLGILGMPRLAAATASPTTKKDAYFGAHFYNQRIVIGAHTAFYDCLFHDCCFLAKDDGAPYQVRFQNCLQAVTTGNPFQHVHLAPIDDHVATFGRVI